MNKGNELKVRIDEYCNERKAQIYSVLKNFNMEFTEQVRTNIETHINQERMQIESILKTGLDIGTIAKHVINVDNLVKYNNEWYFVSASNKKMYLVELRG
jgi:antitoxin component of RelBE/YafQ-DinJ toxin-antitoxin module